MAAQQLHIVVLTTDPTIRHEVEQAAALARLDVAGDAAAALSHVTPDTNVLVIDAGATPEGYLSLIRRARKTAPAVDVTVVGGPKADDVLRRERADGVDHYFARPIEPDMLRSALSHRMRLVELKVSVGIVGRSEALHEVLEAILQVGPTEVPILIEGESGTGKDVVARAIHMASRRRDAAFEAINCGAVAEGVLESELFGHERGAFTGAVARRAGMFERADHGTIFLDEVGETSPNMQVRLLRVLESGEVLRVGGVETFHVDVRVIAATNRRLGDAVRDGSFRQDLYYRLKGIHLRLPPLRERPDDIPILVQYFIVHANRQHHKSIRGIETAALRRLAGHAWPGNIRELRNVVDTAVVLAHGPRIGVEDVDTQLAGEEPTPSPFLPMALNRPKEDVEREMIYGAILALHRDVREILDMVRGTTAARPWDGMTEIPVEVPGEADGPPLNLSQLERSAIQEALARHRGNRRLAADELGISERTLYRKIKEYGLV